MTTKLDRVLKRELTVSGEPYTLMLSEQGFTLTLKGRRKGLDIRWADLVAGDAALATALNASLTANIAPRGKPAARRKDEPEAIRLQVEAARKAKAAPNARPTRPKTRARRPSRPRSSSSGRR